MVTKAVRLIFGMTFVCAAGCFFPSTMPTQNMTGTLHSVHPSSGNGPTQWMLSMGPEGMNTGTVTLDVSKVKDQAFANDGKQVTVEVRPQSDGRMEVENFMVMGPAKQ